MLKFNTLNEQKLDVFDNQTIKQNTQTGTYYVDANFVLINLVNINPQLTPAKEWYVFNSGLYDPITMTYDNTADNIFYVMAQTLISDPLDLYRIENNMFKNSTNPNVLHVFNGTNNLTESKLTNDFIVNHTISYSKIDLTGLTGKFLIDSANIISSQASIADGDITSVDVTKLLNAITPVSGLIWCVSTGGISMKTNLNGWISPIDLTTMITSSAIGARGYLIGHDPSSENIVEFHYLPVGNLSSHSITDDKLILGTASSFLKSDANKYFAYQTSIAESDIADATQYNIPVSNGTTLASVTFDTVAKFSNSFAAGIVALNRLEETKADSGKFLKVNAIGVVIADTINQVPSNPAANSIFIYDTVNGALWQTTSNSIDSYLKTYSIDINKLISTGTVGNFLSLDASKHIVDVAAPGLPVSVAKSVLQCDENSVVKFATDIGSATDIKGRLYIQNINTGPTKGNGTVFFYNLGNSTYPTSYSYLDRIYANDFYSLTASYSAFHDTLYLTGGITMYWYNYRRHQYGATYDIGAANVTNTGINCTTNIYAYGYIASSSQRTMKIFQNFDNKNKLIDSILYSDVIKYKYKGKDDIMIGVCTDQLHEDLVSQIEYHILDDEQNKNAQIIEQKNEIYLIHECKNSKQFCYLCDQDFMKDYSQLKIIFKTQEDLRKDKMPVPFMNIKFEYQKGQYGKKINLGLASDEFQNIKNLQIKSIIMDTSIVNLNSVTFALQACIQLQQKSLANLEKELSEAKLQISDQDARLKRIEQFFSCK